MFNFFDEIKKALKSQKFTEKYNIINISGRILYVEGHLGICKLSKRQISFKVKGEMIIVEGEDLMLFELMDKTLKITGNIKRVEVL